MQDLENWGFDPTGGIDTAKHHPSCNDFLEENRDYLSSVCSHVRRSV